MLTAHPRTLKAAAVFAAAAGALALCALASPAVAADGVYNATVAASLSGTATLTDGSASSSDGKTRANRLGLVSKSAYTPPRACSTASGKAHTVLPPAAANAACGSRLFFTLKGPSCSVGPMG